MAFCPPWISVMGGFSSPIRTEQNNAMYGSGTETARTPEFGWENQNSFIWVLVNLGILRSKRTRLKPLKVAAFVLDRKQQHPRDCVPLVRVVVGTVLGAVDQLVAQGAPAALLKRDAPAALGARKDTRRCRLGRLILGHPSASAAPHCQRVTSVGPVGKRHHLMKQHQQESNHRRIKQARKAQKRPGFIIWFQSDLDELEVANKALLKISVPYRSSRKGHRYIACYRSRKGHRYCSCQATIVSL